MAYVARFSRSPSTGIDSVDDGSLPMCICIPLAKRKVEYADHVVALLVTLALAAAGIFRRIGISWVREEMATKLFGCLSKKNITLIWTVGYANLHQRSIKSK
jgi:hypothetical protein